MQYRSSRHCGQSHANAVTRRAYVLLVQLSDEYSGYLPTREAVEGGSYSSKPASTLIGPAGGELMLEQYFDKMVVLMNGGSG